MSLSCSTHANTDPFLFDKELVVVTGASSGLGRKTCMALLRSGEYHVIGAVREYVTDIA